MESNIDARETDPPKESSLTLPFTTLYISGSRPVPIFDRQIKRGVGGSDQAMPVGEEVGMQTETLTSRPVGASPCG
jgi:hypothetical protein